MVFLWNIEWIKNDFSIVVSIWNHRFAGAIYYYPKNPHLIRTLIKSRKKRNEFFIVASTWNRSFAGALYYYPKNPHLIRALIRSRKKRNGFFIVVNTLVATKWLLMLGKLQDGFTVLLMTETKFGTILTLENNTNPFELLGNCLSCR